MSHWDEEDWYDAGKQSIIEQVDEIVKNVESGDLNFEGAVEQLKELGKE